jgi:hypothetical protein
LKRKIVKTAIFAIIPALLLLLGAELACNLLVKTRWFAHAMYPGLDPGVEPPQFVPIFKHEGFKPDPYSGYRLRASLDETSHRPPDIPQPIKQPGEIRILTLGDSVPFGIRLAEVDAWPGRLAYYLKQWQPEGVTFETYNGGIPGYNPQQCKRLLQSQYMSLAPDIILWQEAPEVGDQLLLPYGQLGLGHRIKDLVFRSKLVRLGVEMKRQRSRGLLRPLWEVNNSPYLPSPDGRIVSMPEFAAWTKEQGIGKFYGVEQLAVSPSGDLIAGNVSSWTMEGMEAVTLTEGFQSSPLEPRTLFIDEFHFSKEGCDIVAQEVSKFLQERWPEIEAAIKEVARPRPNGPPRPAPPGSPMPPPGGDEKRYPPSPF